MIRTTIATALIMAYASAAGGDFGYEENGANWTDAVDPDWAACNNGTEQSPINLTRKGTTLVKDGFPSPMMWADIPVDAGFNPDDLSQKVTLPGGFAGFTDMTSEFITDEDPAGTGIFNPLQFHWHAPSEHAIDGELKDLEVHFVHQNPDTL